MKTEFTLSKHRFYELKHFCLQYPGWKTAYNEADGWSGKGDTTSRDGIKRADLIHYIDLVDSCVCDTNINLLQFVIFDGNTMPPELMYYYRKFFWELSRRR